MRTLPARLASRVNSHGLTGFDSFSLVEEFLVLHDSVLCSVVDFSFCDKVISTTPASKQPTPRSTITPAKIKTLECRRFVCSVESLGVELLRNTWFGRRSWSGEMQFNSWSPIPALITIARWPNDRNESADKKNWCYKDEALKETIAMQMSSRCRQGLSDDGFKIEHSRLPLTFKILLIRLSQEML